MTPLNDKIKPGPHASTELYLLRVGGGKKSFYFSLIRFLGQVKWNRRRVSTVSLVIVLGGKRRVVNL